MGFAPQESGSRPTLQASRIEIVSTSGAVVGAITSDERGGRLDLWTHDGQNVVRLSGNESGGDFNLWNKAGRTVCAAFADAGGASLSLYRADAELASRWSSGPSGAALTLRGQQGPYFSAIPHGEGGDLVLSDAQGTPSLVASSRATGGALRAVAGGGAVLASLETDPIHGGRIQVSGADGATRGEMRASDDGGALTLHAPGSGSASIVSTTSAPGLMQFVRADGEASLTAAMDPDGKSRLSIGSLRGAFSCLIESSAPRGATLSLLGERARKSIVLGAREDGGLMNLFNRHEVAVVAAGHSGDARGGGLTVRNERGLPVVELVTTPTQAGRVIVSDPDGERPRTIDPAGGS